MYESQYLNNKVQAADPVGLVKLLYERAIDRLRQAREFLAEGKIRERAEAISRAMEIVLELQSSLDLERGGEIARNLAQLYAYIQERLVEANARQRREALEEALQLLLILYEGWNEISLDAPVAMAAGPPVEEPTASRAWTL